MTEEDTFNALKQTPIRKIEEIFNLMTDREFNDLLVSKIAMAQFYQSHGWVIDSDEFNFALREFMNERG